MAGSSMGWREDSLAPAEPVAPEFEDAPLTDWDGRLVVVGTRVRLWDFAPGHPHWPDLGPQYVGTVTDLGEWDGDADDEGRSITIVPRVTVAWDDGSEDSWPTSEWEYGPWQEPVGGKVEELAVIGPPDVGRVELRAVV